MWKLFVLQVCCVLAALCHVQTDTDFVVLTDIVCMHVQILLTSTIQAQRLSLFGYIT